MRKREDQEQNGDVDGDDRHEACIQTTLKQQTSIISAYFFFNIKSFHREGM